jgi:hypothetical protein
VLPRPRFRMPLWAVLAIAIAAYLIRSAERGFDFGLDMPVDAIVLFALLAVVALVGWVRADDARRDAEAAATSHDSAESDSTPRI